VHRLSFAGSVCRLSLPAQLPEAVRQAPRHQVALPDLGSVLALFLGVLVRVGGHEVQYDIYYEAKLHDDVEGHELAVVVLEACRRQQQQRQQQLQEDRRERYTCEQCVAATDTLASVRHYCKRCSSILGACVSPHCSGLVL
jgi:hypothetical protein